MRSSSCSRPSLLPIQPLHWPQLCSAQLLRSPDLNELSLASLGAFAVVASSARNVLNVCPCVCLTLSHLSRYGLGIISSGKAFVTHQSAPGAASVLKFITEPTHRIIAPVSLFCPVPDGRSQLFGSFVSPAPNTVLDM